MCGVPRGSAGLRGVVRISAPTTSPGTDAWSPRGHVGWHVRDGQKRCPARGRRLQVTGRQAELPFLLDAGTPGREGPSSSEGPAAVLRGSAVACAARPGLLSPLVSVPTSPNAPLRHAGLPVAHDVSHRGFLIGDITGQQRRRKTFKISRYLDRKGMGAGPTGTVPRTEDVRGLLRAGKRRRWHRPLYSTIVQEQGQNKARYRKTRTEGICSSRLGVFLRRREGSFYSGSGWPGGWQQTWANRRKWRTGSTSEKESLNCLHCPGFIHIVGTAVLLTARR